MTNYWRLPARNLLQYVGMKTQDCRKLKFDHENERIDYQARYLEQELTFSHIKSWTIEAENFEDETKLAMLRRWFD